MKIELNMIPIRDIVNEYTDNNEDGVVGYGGLLNIRPAYQREFVYKDEQRNAVVDTVRKNFPLNAIYWSKNDDGTFELLDGQQRTISFCQYVDGVFSVDGFYFHNLTKEEQEDILNFKCMVFICEGTDRERLEWFGRINIAGEKLTDQELLNANYTGKWLSEAKRLFSKTNCWASKLGGDYVKGVPIRQELLETILFWISEGNIREYMAVHQHDEDASELKNYFYELINWVERTFPKYRKEMKGVEWGRLYKTYGNKEYNFDENEIIDLMEDEDVTKKSGIYEYLLSGKKDDKLLSIRVFGERDKREVYEKQKGICPICGKHFDIKDMHADHIIPWSKGGHTTKDNLQMLCSDCNLKKSDD